MSTKHTPGEWISDKSCPGYNPRVIDSENKLISDCMAARSVDECYANARLIASAPDLLEFLIKLVSGRAIFLGDSMDEATALIKKATEGL